jgi:hypothetical protein
VKSAGMLSWASVSMRLWRAGHAVAVRGEGAGESGADVGACAENEEGFIVCSCWEWSWRSFGIDLLELVGWLGTVSVRDWSGVYVSSAFWG